jgi:hypothetical protein
MSNALNKRLIMYMARMARTGEKSMALCPIIRFDRFLKGVV